MNKTLLIVLGAVLVVALFIGGSYNGLVGKSESVNSAWAQIETQLTRRADLIPNLVQTVKGYAKHESTIMTELAQARAAMIGAKTPQAAMQANDKMSGALGRLMVVVENYPNLKADGQFQTLMDSLEGSENRLAYARTQYNQVVQDYTQSTKMFPGNIIAGMFGFTEKPYFKATEEQKVNPKVEF